jgi:hypothetical protein
MLPFHVDVLRPVPRQPSVGRKRALKAAARQSAATVRAVGREKLDGKPAIIGSMVLVHAAPLPTGDDASEY